MTNQIQMLKPKTKTDLITKTPAVACPPATGRLWRAGEKSKARKREKVGFLKSRNSLLFTLHCLLIASVLIGKGIDYGY
jgi:hypothetical protein